MITCHHFPHYLSSRSCHHLLLNLLNQPPNQSPLLSLASILNKVTRMTLWHHTCSMFLLCSGPPTGTKVFTQPERPKWPCPGDLINNPCSFPCSGRSSHTLFLFAHQTYCTVSPSDSIRHSHSLLPYSILCCARMSQAQRGTPDLPTLPNILNFLLRTHAVWQYINIFIHLIIYCPHLPPDYKVYKDMGLLCFLTIIFQLPHPACDWCLINICWKSKRIMGSTRSSPQGSRENFMYNARYQCQKEKRREKHPLMGLPARDKLK